LQTNIFQSVYFPPSCVKGGKELSSAVHMFLLRCPGLYYLHQQLQISLPGIQLHLLALADIHGLFK